jgi:translation initiation factor IF-2
MNISTLAKILGVSISELRETGTKQNIYGFSGRNTRIPYQSAVELTKILRSDKLSKLENDDKIYLPSTLTVADFAESIGKPAGIVVKTLLMNGVMATLNEKIDYDTASLISSELGIEVFPEKDDLFDNKNVSSTTSLTKSFEIDDNTEGDLVSRPPVVTVMGHVDHGKTTLLDTIRESNVVSGEAGSITQHISSYQINFKGSKITFVDTPGHEAFTAMRARGSQLADFIILMVSAVEGPKPQTIEVIERAKLSKTPVIVAINKIDLPNSDIEKTKNDIAAYGLVPEEWGGQTPFIPISAKLNTNVDTLLDTILLLAEIGNLKGKINCDAQGVVIESNIDEKIGVITNILITRGEFKVGDNISCGTQSGRIKKLIDSNGKDVKIAKITEPVAILGLSSVATVGELVSFHETQKEANKVAEQLANEQNSKKIINNKPLKAEEGEINIVLVADVSGSLEALKESILKIPQEHAKINIKKESIGQLTESDVEFAEISKSTILIFHSSIHLQAQKMLKNKNIPIVQSNIIYEILNWVEEEELKRVKHEFRFETLGKAKVLKLFKSEKSNVQVCGGEVIDGKILANKQIRLWREKEVLGVFEISELQRDKVKASEINISQQFGISLVGKTKIAVGDILESVEEVLVK